MVIIVNIIIKMKTKKINPYDRIYVSKTNQNINVTDYRNLDLQTVLDKISSEFTKRKNTIKEKGSFSNSVTITYFSFSASLNIKRLETDAEYKLRIARYESSEETKRKKEEDKIKKEFKKLEELKEKFKNVNSAEEVIQEIRRKKAEESILPNLNNK